MVVKPDPQQAAEKDALPVWVLVYSGVVGPAVNQLVTIEWPAGEALVSMTTWLTDRDC
jgi:hypothetical protein